MKYIKYSIVIFYCILHVIKLEVFPFYHFGMYSIYQADKRQPYISYDIYINGQRQKFDDWDYRKYTYLMNSVIQYDKINSNNSIDISSEIIVKYLAAIGIQNYDNVYNTYKYPELKSKMTKFIASTLQCSYLDDIVIESVEYSLDYDNNINPINRKVILP